MKPIDHQLERLLRSAARAPGRAPTPVSLATQVRVLAAYRQRGHAAAIAIQQTWRLGLATACATAALAIAAGWLASGRIEDTANDPYVLNDPGLAVVMTTGWLP
ncbi:MAG: hypothetical protein ACKOEQ_16745 [Verrucomicrobiota bacterium]